ncbi:MAG: pyruvate/2-oxoglutarate dehydrogenase complex dihydrolipoamide acyltransferase (E2) component [Verrucomicrobiales bacterium]|jgi:pyruvate/2-oxoglutarate dehydrogenase complex dihydrolipoamide acyltransferase (E2) component
MFEFRLPDVGEGIHEAELVEWMVDVGSAIDEGTLIALVNTDKVSVELPSPASGVVSSLPWNPGDILRVGEVLMVLDGDDSSSASDRADSVSPVASADTATTEEPDRVTTAASESPSLTKSLGRPIAAPSTRKLASELGVDLQGVHGSGPGGRILRGDVDAAAGEPTMPEANVVREPLAGVRGTMFRHMAESSSGPATTTSTFTVRMERVEELVSVLRVENTPSVGVFAVTGACVVKALTLNQRFNATADPASNDLLLHRGIHLGVAVASPSGLVVPVLRDAQNLRLAELSDAIGEVAQRAREGKLSVADLRGGTFTVSSTGGMERARITSAQPLVNLPQVAILWMSRIRDEAVVDDGVVRAGRMMSCSLSFDHRYIDGAEATAFINELTSLIENPVTGLA